MTPATWPYTTPYVATLTQPDSPDIRIVLRVGRTSTRYVASRSEHGSHLAPTWSGEDPISMMLQMLREHRWTAGRVQTVNLQVGKAGSVRTLCWPLGAGGQVGPTDLAVLRGWLLGVGRRQGD